MTPEENKAVAIRHIKDVLEQGRVDLIDSYYAPDGSVEMLTPEQWKETVLWHHKVAPGFKATILDLMAEGDKVMAHTRVDITYSSQFASEYSDPFPPLDKPVTWRNLDVIRIVDGKLVAMQNVFGWTDMLVEVGAIPLKKMEQNKAAARKFVDALNRQDIALLNEVASPEVAQWWTNELPHAYATFKDHHIDITDMVVDGDKAWVRLATSAYHTGEWEGIPPTSKHWTNQGIFYLRFADGKIAEVDSLFDNMNLLKQLGAAVTPAA